MRTDRLFRTVVMAVLTLVGTLGYGAPHAGAAGPRTIIVPSQISTIQSAIDSAANGDVIYVLPGTYWENINFLGKDVWLQGFGPGVTIIDGSGLGPVVSFTSGETPAAVLRGFTIRNGMTDPLTLTGGGIAISDSSPTIIGNQITRNGGVQGIGIGVERGAPLIWGNEISWNKPAASSIGRTNGIGGGIYVGHNNGGPPMTVAFNSIVFNAADQGGAIGVNDGGDLYLVENTIGSNQAYYDGGAYYELNTTKPVFYLNIIANNTAGDGSALYFYPVVTTPAALAANFIYGNYSSSLVGGNGQGVGIKNEQMTINMSDNYLVGEPNHTLFECVETNFPAVLSFARDIVIVDGGAKTKDCLHITGL